MKKKFVLILIVVFMILMLIPQRTTLKDGGTVVYKSLVYSVYKLHRLTNTEGVVLDGTEIEIFGIMVYKNTSYLLVDCEKESMRSSTPTVLQ